MFALSEFRLTFAFGLGVMLLSVITLIQCRGGPESKIKFQPGIIVGSVLFGLGWALTGACPSVVFLQLAHGKIAALISLAGMIVGITSYRAINRKFFGWKIMSCGDVN